MDRMRVLIVGGGIGGLTAAVALCRQGIGVDLVEKQPQWQVSGVGILQQANVVRAMASIGLLDEYVGAGFGFDCSRVYDLTGRALAQVPTPYLPGVASAPMLGVGRQVLHRVLLAAALRGGTGVRLGATLARYEQHDEHVSVTLSDGSQARYGLVIGADGVHSQLREQLFGRRYPVHYTGQAAWRHNFPRIPLCDCMVAMVGPDGGAGLCPLSRDLMYLYVTSAEPGNPHYPAQQLPALMRARLAGFGGFIAQLAAQIHDPAQVVYRPLEAVLVPVPWHQGRVVLLGDAAHATTPHLGQGAGMAIEDAVVLAEELGKAQATAQSIQAALLAYEQRRWERCKYIWGSSVGIGVAELAGRQDIDRAAQIMEMYRVTAQPI